MLTARTTVDLGLQQAAQDAMVNTLRQTGPTRRGKRGYTGAMVSMEPDGAVRAMVGGLDYEDNQFNRATHAHRQPGSSFKLYVYATAFENGYNPRSMVRDFGGACGNWAPSNYSGGGGSGRSMPAIDAFKVSLNVPAVEPVAAGRAREGAGDDAAPRRRPASRRPARWRSATPASRRCEHTAAYAVFANGGKLSKPYAILEIFNSKGDLIYSRDTRRARRRRRS